MEGDLRRNHITNLIIYGIATDYCVKATVMDAIDSGFGVYLLRDLSRGVDKTNVLKALEDMKEKGASII